MVMFLYPNSVLKSNPLICIFEYIALTVSVYHDTCHCTLNLITKILLKQGLKAPLIFSTMNTQNILLRIDNYQRGDEYSIPIFTKVGFKSIFNLETRQTQILCKVDIKKTS